MKRVLLTGLSGFIGRELPSFLSSRGFEVHSAGRSESGSGAGFVHHRCDLLKDDPGVLVRRIAPTHLLHLAWYAEPGQFWSAPENLDWVAASLRLVRAFAASGGARAVLAGSCAEYDWSFPVLDEATTPLKPETLYGEAKASLFRILDRAAPELGLSFAWGRIFYPYGPFEQSERLLGGLFDGIARNEAVSFTAGTQKRDYIHAEDVAAAFAQLLDSDVRGAVNIASGETVAVRDLVTQAARLVDGAPLVSFGTRSGQPGEPAAMSAATARLRDEVGFTPKFTLEAGLRDMAQRRPPPRDQGPLP